jgi:hypothetical protein
MSDVEKGLSLIHDELIKQNRILEEGLRDLVAAVKGNSKPPVVREPDAKFAAGKRLQIPDVRTLLTNEQDVRVKVEDHGDCIKVVPRGILGKQLFADIARVLKEVKAEYISAGRDSHWRVPK